MGRMAAKDQIGDGGILKNMQMLKETLHLCVLNVDVVEDRPQDQEALHLFIPRQDHMFQAQPPLRAQVATKIGQLQMTNLTIEKTVKDTLTSNGAPRMAAKDQIGDGGILKSMQMLKETLHLCVLNVDVVEDQEALHLYIPRQHHMFQAQPPLRVLSLQVQALVQQAKVAQLSLQVQALVLQAKVAQLSLQVQAVPRQKASQQRGLEEPQPLVLSPFHPRVEN